jgi:myo-inositol-1(or 4)-monophosphatase
MTRDFLRAAIEIAEASGALLADCFERDVASYAKSRFDVVTEADHASEALILDRLGFLFPSHGVIAEESGVRVCGDSPYCWHVDPLDGTKNFARGYPAFAVSLALECAGELVAGVVFDPVRQELFSAERGAGAFRNAQRIHVSDIHHLERCLITTGFPSASRHRQLDVDMFHRISMATQGLRRTGSSALDLAYVACGRVDAFWDLGLQSWDVAAGILLVTEAGGRCSAMSGAPFTLCGADLLADNGVVHDAFLQICSGTLRETPHLR